MAPRKKATEKLPAPKKKTARKKSTGKALVSAAELKKQMLAKNKASVEQDVGGDYISIRNSKFSFKSQNLGGKIEVIILGYSYLRTYYDQPFSPDDPSAPACYAVSFEEEGMEPASDAVKPQCDGMCHECELDAWGSDDTGDGKACKEQRRIAVLSAENDLASAEVAYINVPSASLKNWRSYVNPIIKKMGAHPSWFVTEISFDEDYDFPCLQFKIVDEINDAGELNIINEKIDDTESALVEGYDPSNYHEPAPKKKSRATRKPAAKKKATRKRK